MHADRHPMYAFTSYPDTICIRIQVHNDREIVIITGANVMYMNYDLNRSTSKLGLTVHERINRTPWTLSNSCQTHTRSYFSIILSLSLSPSLSVCVLCAMMYPSLFVIDVSFCFGQVVVTWFDNDIFFARKYQNAEFAHALLQQQLCQTLPVFLLSRINTCSQMH